MSEFISEILAKRGLDKCPIPLWKLKITDTEYDQLRDILKSRVISRAFYLSNPFNAVCEEAALFMAEFGRRELCEEGSPSDAAYHALQLPKGYTFAPQFADSACEGAQLLGVDFFADCEEDDDSVDLDDALNMLLFQGGFL